MPKAYRGRDHLKTNDMPRQMQNSKCKMQNAKCKIKSCRAGGLLPPKLSICAKRYAVGVVPYEIYHFVIRYFTS